MKIKTLLTVLLGFLFGYIMAQEAQWASPQPTGNTLWDVAYTTSGTAIAVGTAGTVMVSEDKGVSWEVVDAGTDEDFLRVGVNGTDIFAVSMDGNVYHSDDEGATWGEAENLTENRLHSIHFLDNTTGYIGAQDAELYRTDNGGNSWSQVTFTGTGDIYGIYFMDADEGFVLTTSDLYKTTNGGADWVVVDLGTIFPSTQMHFTDNNRGWIDGFWAPLLVTDDGGDTWEEVDNITGIEGVVTGVAFNSSGTGFMITTANQIFRSLDGGENWTIMYEGEGFDLVNQITLQGVAFDGDDGIFVGSPGQVITTANGTTFNRETNYLFDFLSMYIDVKILDNDDIIAVGEDGMGVYFDDSEGTWEQLSFDTDGDLSAITFTNASNGYIVGENGAYYRSTDGGKTWVSQTPFTAGYLYDIAFYDENTGIAVGPGSEVYKTTDGGANWATHAIDDMFLSFCVSVHFVTEDVVVLGGNGGIAGRSTDGGENWVTASVAGSSTIKDFYFSDANNGFLCANGGTIMRTVNGGDTWTNVPNDATEFLNNIHFMEGGQAYVTGGEGTFFTSTDGGDTWSAMQRFTGNDIVSSDFKGDKGVAVGTRGSIILLGDYEQAVITSTPIFSQEQIQVACYPNPVTHTLRFTAPVEHLMVYTSAGRVILDKQVHGETVDVSALSRGLYLLRYTYDGVYYSSHIVKQ